MARKRNHTKSVAKEVPVYKKQNTSRETLTLEKKASNEVPISRLTLGSQGVDGLRSTRGSINEHAKAELRWPYSIATYQCMSLDPTIAAVNNFYNMMMTRSNFRFEAPLNEDGQPVTEQSQKAAEFLNFCMENMQDQTFDEFLSGIGTYRIYGFSIAEKVWTTVSRGKYKGRKKWKSLAQRSQETVERWTWDKNDPDRLTGVIQRPDALDVERYGTSKATKRASDKQRTIDRSKFLLFRFDPQKNNPQGTSPLDGCWEAWKYMSLVREYQAIGVAKDLGGIPVIGYPVEKLIEAAADPSGAAAATLEALKANAAALHAGDESYVVKPIDYDDTGKELYSFELMGVQGGGKQYDTGEIIQQYQNEILTVYSASLLKVGQGGSGSFALSDNMNSLLGYGVEHHLNIIKKQINNDLVPQTLAINGWLFDEEEMPKLVCDDLTPEDLDKLGQYIQRVVTSGAVTVGKKLDNDLRVRAGLPVATYETSDEVPEAFSTQKESGAGKGDGTSGTGGSQINADNNKSNS